MDKYYNLHVSPDRGFTQQTAAALFDRYRYEGMLVHGSQDKAGITKKQNIKRISTKKHNPNKNLSHTIHFAFSFLLWIRVYINLHSKNGLKKQAYRLLVSGN